MGKAESTSGRKQRPRLCPLWLQVLLAIALGAALGTFFPHTADKLKPLGDGFIRLITMTLGPIIFCSVVLGIARMGDLKEVDRVGVKALVYFEVVSSMSLLLGLIAIDVLHPGRGMNINATTLNGQAVAGYAASAQSHSSFVAFLLNIIPTSLAGAFTGGNVLQIILIGVLFGLAISQVRAKAQPLMDILDQVLRAMFSIVGLIMLFAPVGAFGAMAYSVGQYGLGSLVQMAEFTAEVWLVSLVFVVVVLGLIARLADFSLFRLVRYIGEELLITFGYLILLGRSRAAHA